MRRIWFNQQKQFDYMPLRAGLGYISASELPSNQVPKIYTSRLSSLSGEYIVVEGSRFKAKPVEPRIEFQVTMNCKLDLKNALVTTITEKCGEVWAMLPILSRGGFSFPELDIGIRGVSFSDFRNTLLKLYPKSAVDTPFYISKLEPVDVK